MDIIEEIEKLPHYRKYTCHNCGHEQEVYILDIIEVCGNCGSKSKLRGFTPVGSETEDVIDAVLHWIGSDKEFNLAMKRKKEIDIFIENDEKKDK